MRGAGRSLNSALGHGSGPGGALVYVFEFFSINRAREREALLTNFKFDDRIASICVIKDQMGAVLTVDRRDI
jgi:hypothetical protein